MSELFGLKISEGAISNAFQRLADPLEKTRAAIRKALQGARVIASDETTTRVGGVTHWHWVFVSDKAVLHESAPRRAKAIAESVLGDHRPEVWVSDRYVGQQDMADAHQACLAPSRRCFTSPVGQCMSCATCSMPSIAVTVLSLRKFAICCDGQSGSADDETTCRIPLWLSITRRLNAGSTPCSDLLLLIRWPGAASADQGMADQILRLHDRPACSGDKQHLRTRNPAIRRIPKSHQRLSLRLGRGRSRWIPVPDKHREAPRSHCHRRCSRARLRSGNQRYRPVSANLVSNYTNQAPGLWPPSHRMSKRQSAEPGKSTRPQRHSDDPR